MNQQLYLTLAALVVMGLLFLFLMRSVDKQLNAPKAKEKKH